MLLNTKTLSCQNVKMVLSKASFKLTTTKSVFHVIKIFSLQMMLELSSWIVKENMISMKLIDCS